MKAAIGFIVAGGRQKGVGCLAARRGQWAIGTTFYRKSFARQTAKTVTNRGENG